MLRVISHKMKENSFWTLLEERTEEEPTFAFPENVFLKAVKNKGLERSFKQAIPNEVYEQLEKEMEQIETE